MRISPFSTFRTPVVYPSKSWRRIITLRKPAVFSPEQTDYGASVIEAVRASTCYPFAFQPLLKNGRRLVDGGLSSNLPAFLFEEEFRQTRIPALAFDLIAPPSGTPVIYHMG